MALMWFIAGGLTALVIARAVSRWMRRLFWLVVAAAFAFAAFAIAPPYLAQVDGGRTQQTPTSAMWRDVLGEVVKRFGGF